MHHDAWFSSLFIDFHRISSIFLDFLRFSSIFFDFRRFSSIFFDFLRFSSIFIDFYRYSSIFVDFPRFSSIFIDFPRFSSTFIDFYRISLIFVDFHRISLIFVDFRRFSSIFAETAPRALDRGTGHRDTVWWGSALSVAARGSTPPRFSSQVPLIRSHRTRAEEDAAETTQQRHDGVAQRPRCHHRVQGSSVNPFGYPPLSDFGLMNGEFNVILQWST